MKVHDPNASGMTPPESSKSQESQRINREEQARTKVSGATSSNDRVELSGLAARVARALQTSSSERAGRVERLAQDYQAGRLSVDSARVSQALITDALHSATS